MPSNEGVADIKPGQVEVRDIEYPTFELQDSPGVHPANMGRTGQCPVMRYHRELMMAIHNERVSIAKNVITTVIPPGGASEGYKEFDHGAERKYILDPHGMLPQTS